ncbi:hypothetical protein [Streptomyces sp. CS081A]|uniref:hypothetical protein n=1 Tax=Streptomyces sp. CS081A TaxID=2162709 RepID=UPI000D5096AC|nr:hypothetical protein [Streptomyces sp. CS081A]PVC73483.1 hypothetical protein DBP18_14145 [Streptomyces sp. CS081A]
MSIHGTYKDTRRELRRLIRDARPGDRLHTITDRATFHPSQPKKVYEVWVVTNKKAFGSGTYYAQSTANGGELSLEQILSKHRAVYETPFGAVDAAAQVRHETYNDAAHRAAQAVADRHAEEVANRLSRQYASSR